MARLAGFPRLARGASLKSFKPRDGSDEPPAGGGRNAEADFRGKKRSNEHPMYWWSTFARQRFGMFR
jgi:hypothetical protein